ncbi:MAG TPA: ribonuclease R, partial [Bdellovibrionota bacterium]|nr:ribonuclease R [Bdellovibrionota bacterium]
SRARRSFKKLLRQLEKEGELTLTRDKRYLPTKEDDFIIGKVDKKSKGFAFIIPEDRNIDDIFVKGSELRDAMSGDRVKVSLVQTQKRGAKKSAAGRVVAIMDRAYESASGALFKKDHRHYVTCSFDETFEIPEDELKHAQLGDLVEIKITTYPHAHGIGKAKITKVFGRIGNIRAETDSIIANHRLYTEFRNEALKEAESISEQILPENFQRRKDIRPLPIVTIDGEDARDFDDAVCVIKTEGGYKLYVSIADVAHYVVESSSLDQDAYDRGCSTYFPDKVLPMLPEKLSNNLCSLRPHEDRLTMTCEIDFSSDGKRLRYKIYESVIKSSARLTYNIVQAIFNDEPETKKQYEQLVLPLKNMYELFRILKRQREDRGALDFDLPEPYIIVDAQGKTTDIQKRERLHSHMLIEEFMIAANEAVAHYLSEKNQPTLYRIHEKPADEKIRSLSFLLHNLGYRMGQLDSPKQLGHVLKQCQDKPEENLINIVTLRSLKKARYSPVNLKHFALASSYYLHFTSPIRRYPDLIVHRSLKKLSKTMEITDMDRDIQVQHLDQAGLHLSERERISEEAEREVVAYKKVLFMKDKVGETFHGHISGVMEFGLFIELDKYYVEGLLHVNELIDDFYQFIEEHYLLRGLKNKREFRLGDKITVKIAKVDLNKKQIDFTLLSD